MNIEALREAEAKFMAMYPGGFDHPEMVKIGKKHKMQQLETFAKEHFSEAKCDDVDELIANAAKLVARSSMVSMFAKPKFRDFTKALQDQEKMQLADAYYEILHGSEQEGFELLVEELKKHNSLNGHW